ncbi:hypothetical protein Pan241w_10900 [Gimesia alba]|uniref:Uncharacterized protein n=1 Tax=Gimesia alba TaxID=2527973 RepID=A0A517RAY1_9PLAN|nr:hypothetical protein [Gimesia alba]QDT41031.1 hypothetical protein Pan241w_10900 [Gimesia alba]
MLKHEITVERYRELTKDRIEPDVALMMFGSEIKTLRFFSSPHGGVVGVLLVKSGQPRDCLGRRPWRYFEHKSDEFFFFCLVREDDDLYHYLRRSGKYVNRETCRDELIGQIGEFVIRGFDRPFAVGGILNNRRVDYPKEGKTRAGYSECRELIRDGERLVEQTDHHYEWNKTDQKWHFTKKIVHTHSSSNEFEVILMKCGTTSEIRKSPKGDNWQFRVNGGSWTDFPRSMEQLRRFLPSVTTKDIEGGVETAMTKLALRMLTKGGE